MKFGVRILPKKGFLDPQGRAVEALLKEQHKTLNTVHVGKWIEVQVNEKDAVKAFKAVEQMAMEVLANPMTESFEVEKLES
ncbi:MAG: phosphoribosylformylglycinamidine synthase subunit PurS [Bdellovibrionota bacterium]